MTDYVAFECPALLFCAGAAALFIAGASLGWLACYALGIKLLVGRIEQIEEHAAKASSVAEAFNKVHAKIDEHLEGEHSGPLSVRSPRPVRT